MLTSMRAALVAKSVLSLCMLIGGILLLAYGNNDDGELRNDGRVEHYGYAMTQLLGCGLTYPFVYHMLIERHNDNGESTGSDSTLFDRLYGLSLLATLGGWVWSWVVIEDSGDYLEQHYSNVWAALIFVNVTLTVAFIFAVVLCSKACGDLDAFLERPQVSRV